MGGRGGEPLGAKRRVDDPFVQAPTPRQKVSFADGNSHAGGGNLPLLLEEIGRGDKPGKGNRRDGSRKEKGSSVKVAAQANHEKALPVLRYPMMTGIQYRMGHMVDARRAQPL